MKNFVYGDEHDDIGSDLDYLSEHEREYYYELLNYKDVIEQVKDKLNSEDCLLVLNPSIDRDISFFPLFYYNDDLAHNVKAVFLITPPYVADFEHDTDDEEFELYDGDGNLRKFKYIIELEGLQHGSVSFERFLKYVLRFVEEEDKCIVCKEARKKYGDHCIRCASSLDGAGVGAELDWLGRKIVAVANMLCDEQSSYWDDAIEKLEAYAKKVKNGS